MKSSNSCSGFVEPLSDGASARRVKPEIPLSRQLVEQCLCVFQVSSCEALGEPAVDVGEHRACLIAAALFREQPRDTRGRAQLERFGALLSRNLNRALKAVLSFLSIRIVLLYQQLAFQPMRLGL